MEKKFSELKIGKHDVVALVSLKTEIMNFRSNNGTFFKIELFDGIQTIGMVFFNNFTKYFDQIKVWFTIFI